MGIQSFVSLFSGAGGLDLSLERAGWSCRYSSDIDKSAVTSLLANQGRRVDVDGISAFEGAFIERADVRQLSGREILARCSESPGSISLLAGGPPCQSWSSAGHQLGLKDPRGQLFIDFVRIANELDVRWMIFENVRGLLTARGPDGRPGSALELIRKRLFEAGFQTTVRLLNAADFGVPQRRVRLFIVGYRTGDPPPFPIPTYSGKGEDCPPLLPWKTLRECLTSVGELSDSEIIRPRGKLAADLRNIAPGSGVKSPGKKETTRPGGHWGYKQGAFVADLDRPARTVTASGQQDWIRDETHGLRRLCPRECAAIQTFPLDWDWGESKSSAYKLIGNAVPPDLAKAIGTRLIEHCDEFSDPMKGLKLVDSLAPLPSDLANAIEYTLREERSNGASRRQAPNRRTSKLAQQYG